MSIQSDLFDMRDEGYKAFHAKLVPTLDPERIIGVRTPKLRRYAAQISKTPQAAQFMNELPHRYYEENNIHAFLAERIRDFDAAIFELERFLPYIDNWATCDAFVPKAFTKNTDRLLPFIEKWLKSDNPYTVRYAIGLLMKLYLKENFSEEYPRTVAAVKSDEYYINMMIAWYFATALAFRYDEVFPYIRDGRLGKWVNNKTIQKAVESRRISEEQKAELKRYKRTGKLD